MGLAPAEEEGGEGQGQGEGEQRGAGFAARDEADAGGPACLAQLTWLLSW